MNWFDQFLQDNLPAPATSAGSIGNMRPILNLRSYTLIRTTAPDPVNGRNTPGVETMILITANVQPVSAKQLMSLPEARRTEKMKRFFTSTQIYNAGEIFSGVQYNADQIVINGERYEVFQIDEWSSTNFECLAARTVTP